MNSTGPDIGAAVRRTVGLATLRRLHRMIADERRGERRDAGIALHIGIGCAVCAVLTVVWLALR